MVRLPARQDQRPQQLKQSFSLRPPNPHRFGGRSHLHDKLKAMNIIYFSNITNTTHRLVQRINLSALVGTVDTIHRLPIRAADITEQHIEEITAQPYILITPSYGDRNRGHLPHPVRALINSEQGRSTLTAVIGTGNTNFGKEYGLAGKLIANKLGIPLLATIELAGLPEDGELLTSLIRQHAETLIRV